MSHPQRVHRRRSPLVAGAVAFFVFACIGVVFVVTRSSVDRSDQTIRSVEIAEPDNVVVARADSGQAVVGVSRTTRDTPDAGAVALPAWARSPGIWTTPFPEGGRYNPPLPEVKLPPEMIGSTSPDAPLASPDAGVSADGKQLDVVDEHALR
jgi:hypothetical protein